MGIHFLFEAAKYKIGIPIFIFVFRLLFFIPVIYQQKINKINTFQN